ncbi:MAG: hypothetical protein LUH82_04230, partial [Clostridiales bacterium]|nr:hypothetical protein [Clostridiales bacterium]
MATVTAPTCTEKGYTTYTCSVCGDTYTGNETDATGHSYESTVTAPTCTEGGYTTYTCSVCGDSYTADETEATGHTAGEQLTDDETYVAATCTTDGSYDLVTYCSVCGNEIAREKITIAETGHSYESSVTKEATCTEEGELTYSCINCDAYYTESIEKIAHTPDGGTVTKEATCTEEGVLTYYCTVCNTPISTESIAMAAHEYESAVTKEATCTAEGEMTYTCKNCGGSYTETIAKTAHTYALIEESAATCTESGWTYNTAQSASQSVNSASASVLAAAVLDGESETYYYTCAVCGQMASADTATADENTAFTELSEEDAAAVVAAHTVAASGHTAGEAVEENYVAPTATEDGSVDIVYYCTDCGEEISRETQVLPATGETTTAAAGETTTAAAGETTTAAAGETTT